MIDILFKIHCEQVQEYYSIDWPKARIQITPVCLSRKTIRTQNPICDVPPQQRNSAIMQVLDLDNIVPYDIVDPQAMGVLKKLKDTSLSSRMSLVS